MSTDHEIAREYAGSLVRLQELSLEGRDESDQAEAVRRNMDELWDRLGEEARSWLGGLSADLYMLSGEEIPDAPDPATPDAASLAEAMIRPWQNKDWTIILKLLRQPHRFFEPSYVAFWRSRAYESQGFHEAALAFMDHAAKLNPLSSYAALSLQLLRKSERIDEAMSRAADLLAHPGSSPFVIVVASSTLFSATKSMTDAEAARVYEQLRAALEHAIQQWLSRDPPSTELVAMAWALLGLCHESLGHLDAARHSYDAALVVEPGHEIAVLARALLLAQQSDPTRPPSVQTLQARRENRLRLAALGVA